MWSIFLRHVFPTGSSAPKFHKKLRKLSGCNGILSIRSHIVITGKVLSFFQRKILRTKPLHKARLPCRNFQVHCQGLQNMLIGANRIRISYSYRLCIHTRPYAIRDNPVLCKISATDYISRSSSGNTWQYCSLISLSVRLGKERFLIAVCQNLRAGLGIGVRIKAVQLFLLRKSMVLHIVVLIDLICRYI